MLGRGANRRGYALGVRWGAGHGLARDSPAIGLRCRLPVFGTGVAIRVSTRVLRMIVRHIVAPEVGFSGGGTAGKTTVSGCMMSPGMEHPSKQRKRCVDRQNGHLQSSRSSAQSEHPTLKAIVHTRDRKPDYPHIRNYATREQYVQILEKMPLCQYSPRNYGSQALRGALVFE
jgi:hypothetical protein